jgi:hypothetical protein
VTTECDAVMQITEDLARMTELAIDIATDAKAL